LNIYLLEPDGIIKMLSESLLPIMVDVDGYGVNEVLLDYIIFDHG
jgi:hypothetical protein